MSQGSPSRLVIQYPAPAVDGGRYPVKRVVGDRVAVEADVFRDGHELLRAVVKYRPVGTRRWHEGELHRIDAQLEGVRWGGEFVVDAVGRWEYTVEAWSDSFGTWRAELRRKLAAGQSDLAGEISEGVVLIGAAAERPRSDEDRATLESALATIETDPIAALDEQLFDVVERWQERHDSASLERPVPIEVDRMRARFGSWYELFPRSWGGLRGVEQQLPRLSELGFDVIYLPPIHPIGHTNRKGRDNALVAAPGDPGSPWAIGDETGGHDAIHSELGTEDDLRSLVTTARAHEIDIALDFAIQASADHPWLTEHPDWFHRRPDGTLKYAENPPKRYQDIYNVNWDS
ncbi:MAG TPA: maltotransferase domain-containing protein, partial [Solirubrobacteraceae bacterium]|nr:maltotransferase domain-containing protein [Solirubrobacteraceae bacterium]